MSVHDEILGFLDGSLSADAEAELLHRMSVSPERLSVLRSYLQQQSLIAQDRSSINVPFEAEQGLWARLDRSMSAVPAAMAGASVATMTTATSVGLLGKFSAASATLVASLLLVLGFGGGYLAGNSSDDSAPQLASVSQANIQQAAPTVIYRNAEPQIITKERVVTRYITRYVTLPAAGPAVAALQEDDIASLSSSADAAISAEPYITLAQPKMPGELAINVGGEQLKPIFMTVEEGRAEVKEKSVLERFEFSFNESFGRQFPNNEATNNSLPLITNSSVSIYFQVLPRSEKLWAGFSVGTANVTKKDLFTNELDIMDERVIRADTVHAQSNWVGGFLQYRIPVSTNVDLTTTAGYGFGSEGNMLIGEIGAHVHVTRDVGFTAGLRGTRLSYDLKGEMDELMAAGKGSLSVPRGIADATPSYNLELATGLFFHF